MNTINKIENSLVEKIENLISIQRGQTISKNIVSLKELSITFYSLSKDEDISKTKWDKDTFLFCFYGELKLIIKNKEIYMKKNDIILISKNDYLELIATKNTKFIQIQIGGNKMDLIRNIDKNMVKNIKSLVDFQKGQISNLTLVKEPSLNFSILALDEGEILNTHSAPGDAFVLCLEGEGEIIIDKEKFNLKEEDTIVMPKDIPHSVRAIKPFKMMLVLVKETK